MKLRNLGKIFKTMNEHPVDLDTELTPPSSVKSLKNQSVKLITVTPQAEQTMGYVARVSNPNNQENPNVEGLLKYCIKHEHWSVFEQAYMTLEINTTRGLAAQILRHRSFTFQEFSQRYADTNLLTTEISIPELRRQDTKNRQNSTDDLDPELVIAFERRIKMLFAEAQEIYDDMLGAGVAKESARFILPLAVPTRIYMTGSVRSWVHYIKLRSANGTQKEHMEIAEMCKEIFSEQFPTVAKALEWN
jgi:thymidylate synthase (FAD)